LGDDQVWAIESTARASVPRQRRTVPAMRASGTGIQVRRCAVAGRASNRKARRR
jgi:hypothetical protein